ncbi:MAG: cryptochrome/photolyase family protein [Acidimicrobiales bacterium]
MGDVQVRSLPPTVEGALDAGGVGGRAMTAEGDVALVVFTRDLRIADNPALCEASRAPNVVCAFVHDDSLLSATTMNARRTAFLADCLADLDVALRRFGTRLEQRRGDWVAEVLRLASETRARSIHLSDDVTPYARRRFARLEEGAAGSIEVCRSPGLAVVPPGVITPTGGDHYRVFTPYYRRWLDASRRRLLAPPTSLRGPEGPGPAARQDPVIASGELPVRPPHRTSRGGEAAAEERLARWAAGAHTRYGQHGDDLAEPATSGLSPYLHFGCISPLQVEVALGGLPGADQFVRQLCWRDFYFQILGARPTAAWSDFVERGEAPRSDPLGFGAWCDGLTGVPIVDAAMRQLASEGTISNRARMIAASFLTRRLGVDWRDGARYFLRQLVDADVALNNLNWQWMAGRGTGSNPQRVLSPTRQARRFDPLGTYVRRHVPELRDLEPGVIHEPWLLAPGDLSRLGYPEPIVPYEQGRAIDVSTGSRTRTALSSEPHMTMRGRTAS